MATMTITIFADNAVDPIEEGVLFDDQCLTQRSVTVRVPTGESRQVRITSSGRFTSPGDGIRTITSDTTYSLIIDAAQIGGGNTILSFVNLTVLNGNNLEGRTGITRSHTPNVC